MRGEDDGQGSVFSYVSAEERIPADHRLRVIRKTVDEVLRSMSKQFDAVYADSGRYSIAPERLLRALLLQCFYSIRSERMLVEQINYSWLLRMTRMLRQLIQMQNSIAKDMGKKPN
jgi:transposase